MTAAAARRPEAALRVSLRDGSAALVRSVRNSDARIVTDVFRGMSRESRWLRFLSPKHRLTDSELRYLTDVDGHDHEAIAALANGRGVGIARYIRQQADPRVAEISISVVDEWHGRGLGTALFERLRERGREEGIDRFFALVSLRNAVALRLLRRQGADLVSVDESGGGTVEVELPLGSNGLEQEVLASLRALRPRRPDDSEWIRPVAISASAPWGR
jgi:acetyltransferase